MTAKKEYLACLSSPYCASQAKRPSPPHWRNRCANAWGGRDLTWLAPREAVEFECLQQPDTLWQVWQEMQELRIDLVVQPSAGRRKKMLLADMDSTMIEQECIDELAMEAGVGGGGVADHRKSDEWRIGLRASPERAHRSAQGVWR